MRYNLGAGVPEFSEAITSGKSLQQIVNTSVAATAALGESAKKPFNTLPIILGVVAVGAFFIFKG